MKTSLKVTSFVTSCFGIILFVVNGLRPEMLHLSHPETGIALLAEAGLMGATFTIIHLAFPFNDLNLKSFFQMGSILGYASGTMMFLVMLVSIPITFDGIMILTIIVGTIAAVTRIVTEVPVMISFFISCHNMPAPRYH